MPVLLNRDFINHNIKGDREVEAFDLRCSTEETRLKEVKCLGQGYKSEANLEFLIVFSIWCIEITKIINSTVKATQA